jgi:hypothetical protein
VTGDPQLRELERQARLGPLQHEASTGVPPWSHHLRALALSGGPLILAVLAIGIEQSAWTFVSVAIGLILLGAGVTPALVWQRRRTDLRLYQRGLVLLRGSRSQTVLFDEVESLALEERDLLRNGVPWGVRRRLDLRFPNGRTRLFDASPTSMRGVTAVVESAVERVTEAARRRIDAGGALHGNRWSLDSSSLTLCGRRLSRRDVTLTAVLQDAVALWTSNVSPLLSLPTSSPNARILARLLGPAGEEGSPAFSGHALGRRLIVSRPGRFVPSFIVLFAGLMILGAATALRKGKTLEVVIGGGLGLLLLRQFLPDLVTVLHVHERGLRRRGLRGWRAMPYADMDHLTVREVRTTEQGFYTGTWLSFAFRAEGQPPMLFTYRSTRGGERDLLGLRDQVAAAVAERMRERLLGDGSVPWTESARLTKQGVGHTRDVTGPVVPYRSFERWREEKDHLLLFRAGEETAIFKLPRDGEDYLPGRIVFESLVAESKPSPRTFSRPKTL